MRSGNVILSNVFRTNDAALFRASNLDVALGGDDAVDGGLGERVELPVVPPHEVRLQQVAAVAVVLKFTLKRDREI